MHERVTQTALHAGHIGVVEQIDGQLTRTLSGDGCVCHGHASAIFVVGSAVPNGGHIAFGGDDGASRKTFMRYPRGKDGGGQAQRFDGDAFHGLPSPDWAAFHHFHSSHRICSTR